MLIPNRLKSLHYYYLISMLLELIIFVPHHYPKSGLSLPLFLLLTQNIIWTGKAIPFFLGSFFFIFLSDMGPSCLEGFLASLFIYQEAFIPLFLPN